MDIESKKPQSKRAEIDDDEKLDEKAIEITGGPDDQEEIEENVAELEKLAKRENDKKKFLEELTTKEKNGEEGGVINVIWDSIIRTKKKLEPTD